MDNTTITQNSRIYLRVGYTLNPENEPRLEDENAPAGRSVVRSRDKEGRIIKSILLAVYETAELSEWDRRVIAKHKSFDAILEDGSVVKYQGFTYDHFFETLRATKLRILGRKGMLEADDGTIFGRCTKQIRISEKVIPAHNYDLSVEWDCWNDLYQTDEDGGDRYG
jgi:hypothetical protein